MRIKCMHIQEQGTFNHLAEAFCKASSKKNPVYLKVEIFLPFKYTAQPNSYL